MTEDLAGAGISEGPSFARAELAKLGTALTKLSDDPYPGLLTRVAECVVGSLRAGGRVLLCGNGGSAADAQHLAAELVGRQNYDRPPTAGLALTVDTSALTALANDYGFESVFARQVDALGRPGDVLIGISTSGRSANVVAPRAAATAGGLRTVAFTGAAPRDMAGAEVVLAVPATETSKIQELHITCGHIVFALVERSLHPPGMAGQRGPGPATDRSDHGHFR